MLSRSRYIEMYNIVGAAMEVHNILGAHLEESIYQYAMREELKLRDIPFTPEKLISVDYKGILLKPFFKADFICFDDIIVEFKSVEKLCSEHRAQIFNYMHLIKSNRGILMNFGGSSLVAERYYYDDKADEMILLTKDNLQDYVSDI